MILSMLEHLGIRHPLGVVRLGSELVPTVSIPLFFTGYLKLNMCHGLWNSEYRMTRQLLKDF